MPVHIVTPSDAGGQHRTTLKNFVDRLRGEGRRWRLVPVWARMS